MKAETSPMPAARERRGDCNALPSARDDGTAAVPDAAVTPLEAAIATGLPCFPCQWSNKAPAIPGPGGYKHATADQDALRQLWWRYPGRLVGVATGEISGLDVLDIDGVKRPEAAAWLAKNRHRLPVTRVHRTRSGGLHLMLKHAPGVRISASRIARGVDVRGDGGYAIWWPAAGYSVVCDVPPAPWPQWLLEALLSPGVSPRPQIHDGKGLLSPAVRISILKPLERAIARAPEGRRNCVLFWAACRVGEVISAGQINSESAAEVLARAAVIGGLPEAEARRTIASGFARAR
jgi:hypothetical protein